MSWELKKSQATRRRSKTVSKEKSEYRDPSLFNGSVEYCYQEWIAPTRWIVEMEPKGSVPTQVPYRNPAKEVD